MFHLCSSYITFKTRLCRDCWTADVQVCCTRTYFFRSKDNKYAILSFYASIPGPKTLLCSSNMFDLTCYTTSFPPFEHICSLAQIKPWWCQHQKKQSVNAVIVEHPEHWHFKQSTHQQLQVLQQNKSTHKIIFSFYFQFFFFITRDLTGWRYKCEILLVSCE